MVSTAPDSDPIDKGLKSPKDSIKEEPPHIQDVQYLYKLLANREEYSIQIKQKSSRKAKRAWLKRKLPQIKDNTIQLSIKKMKIFIDNKSRTVFALIKSGEEPRETIIVDAKRGIPLQAYSENEKERRYSYTLHQSNRIRRADCFAKAEMKRKSFINLFKTHALRLVNLEPENTHE